MSTTPAPRNGTVEHVRAWTAFATHGKQTGRRYGPPPKNLPSRGMQAPSPMSTGDRDRAYRRSPDFYRLTPRQERQWIRMAERAGEIARDRPGAKGRGGQR